MAFIDTFNTNISKAVNVYDDFYEAWFGAVEFTPESIIDESGDYNCGAICNELEFARAVSDYYVSSMDIDAAEGDELELLVQAYIDLPRRSSGELDTRYRNRFKFLVVEKANYRRTTRWAILDAISYFILDMDTVQLVEKFDSSNLYFELRFEGEEVVPDGMFVENQYTGFINQNFVGGVGIGEAVSFIGELLDRIKAAGVDYDVRFITQSRTTLDGDCTIGSVQQYLETIAYILRSESLTRTCDATIV